MDSYIKWAGASTGTSPKAWHVNLVVVPLVLLDNSVEGPALLTMSVFVALLPNWSSRGNFTGFILKDSSPIDVTWSIFSRLREEGASVDRALLLLVPSSIGSATAAPRKHVDSWLGLFCWTELVDAVRGSAGVLGETLLWTCRPVSQSLTFFELSKQLLLFLILLLHTTGQIKSVSCQI